MITNAVIANPFPGLRSFEEHENILFFGREKQVDELVKKLRTSRFIAVIGSSGSGKSSLVKSGVIPALQSGFMSGAGSSWHICSFRPGNNPIGNLAEAMVSLDLPGEESNEQTLKAIGETTLRRSSNGLIEIFKQSGIPQNENLLILVDQFEEIFRFNKFESEARDGKRDSVAFINLLLKATSQTHYPVYVVFTMRSDFLSDCAEFRGLPEAINEGNYLVPRMTREERREAITGPIAVANAKISQQLVNQLLNDVGDNPDQLPIMQHALMRTWDTWKQKNKPGEPIDTEDYEEIGTMASALSRHAEEAYMELGTEHAKKICEVLFKALTDKSSDSRGIRRPTMLGEICSLTGASVEEVAAVIDVFRKNGHFLMPPENVPLTETTIIDISHESIMRVWERLINWLNDENASAEIYNRLCEAAVLYEDGKGGLWRDPELQLAWNWKEETHPNKIWAQRYNDIFEKGINFLEYSKKQFELERKHKEEMQRRRLKRAKQFVIIISTIAIGALFMAIYAFQQTAKATAATVEAKKANTESERQKDIAVKAKDTAVIARNLADSSKREALKQTQIAVKARDTALIAKNQAVESEKQTIQMQYSKEEIELELLWKRANTILDVKRCPVEIVQQMIAMSTQHPTWKQKIEQLKTRNQICNY